MHTLIKSARAVLALGAVALLLGLFVGTPASAEPDPDVRIASVKYNARGVDGPSNLNQEWITLKNYGSLGVELNGYVIEDAQGHEFHFPAYVLSPAASVSVHTGSGVNSVGHLYWNRLTHTWNNAGDVASFYPGDPDAGAAREDRVSWDPFVIVAS